MGFDFVLPEEIDKTFDWQPGLAQRLAKRGKLPAYRLPDGQIRFDLDEIKALVTRLPMKQEAANAS